MSYPMSYPVSHSISPLQGKDAALFVYLAWGTRDGNPLLDCDQMRQAAYLAITIRLRSQFCHVISIGGTINHIHLIARFPPSMPISAMIRMVQEASGEAITHRTETFEGRSLNTRTLWERHYTSHTLGLTNPAEAHAYLRRQIIGEEKIRL